MAQVHTARKKMDKKKRMAAIMAIILIAALLLGGVFAWNDFSQSFINRFRGGSNADVLLHDDFKPWENKDVYVENTGETPLIVRVLFREYFQVGNQVLAGTDPDDTSTWPIHFYDKSLPENACELPTHDYFQWEMTGGQKIYLHDTSEQGDEDYKSMIIDIVTKLNLWGDNTVLTADSPISDFEPWLENSNVLGPNGQMFGKTVETGGIISIDDWMKYPYAEQKDIYCWILDTDGWAYWSQWLAPNEATNLILDNVSMIKSPDDNFNYMIDVQLQAVNKTEWKKLTTSANGLPVVTDGALDEIIDFILDEDIDLDIAVNVANPVDVQLAVGMTDVEYARFENDLRRVLAQKDPALTDPDLSITTGAKVSATNRTDEFAWWIYDHTRSTRYTQSPVAAIMDDTNHIYVHNDASSTMTGSALGTLQESNSTLGTYTPPASAYVPDSETPDPSMKNPDIGLSVHPYQGNYRHMIESNGGATMDVYGYGQYAYKDFMYLPTSDKAPKTFEFAIAEDLAYDALDGIGFLFNTDIAGSYVSGTQTMSGYLLFLEYSSGKGTKMVLYKFQNINARDFHHDKISTSAGSIASSFVDRNGNKFIQVATAAYPGTDFSRRIKVEAGVDYINVWYKGSTEKNHADTLATEIDKYATPVDPLVWTISSNGALTGQLSGSTTSNVKLDTNIITSYGFGPLSSYLGHGCARPTHVTFKDLTMTTERPRSLLEVLQEKKESWIEGTNKFVVDLNQKEAADFNKPETTGEILSLLEEDDIFYIGWCGDENEEQSETFLKKCEQNGTLVNVDDSSSNYESQIQAIADAIYEKYLRQDVGDTVLVTDKVTLDVKFNIPDEELKLIQPSNAHWPYGKWKVVHRTEGFDSTDGIHSESEKYRLDLDIQLDKPGYYDIFYKDKLQKTVIMHRAPVASFNVTDGASPTFTSTSYDPDDLQGGIVSEKWSYIDLSTSATAFTSGKPSTLISGHSYLVKLEVKDKHGAISASSREIHYP